MRLEKLSASSLQVSETCMARFKADRDADRSARKTASYALLGSSCHQALEDYVRTAIIECNAARDMKTLELFFMKAYKDLFRTFDTSTEEYKDGMKMLEGWYERTDFGYFEILSLESKEHFELPTSAGPIKFTYIFDRLDKLEDDVYRVVDYKTSREYLTPEGLENKIQAKIYALACQIKFPKAKRITVQFDMLRHRPVAVTFTRDDNVNTWKILKEAAERIIAEPEDEPAETLNDQCLFCIRKTNCTAVRENIKAGGVFAHQTIEEMVNARTLIAFQKKAADAALKELDNEILTYMKENDTFDVETPLAVAKAKVYTRRKINPEEVRLIVGEEIFLKYGGYSLSMKSLDQMLESDDLNFKQTSRVTDLIEHVPGEPSVDTKLRGAFDA